MGFGVSHQGWLRPVAVGHRRYLTGSLLVVGTGTAALSAASYGAVALLGLPLFLAIWLLLRPLGGIAETLRRLARGDLAARTGAGRASGRLGGLAQAVDTLASRLAADAAERKRQDAERATAQAAAEAASAAKTRFIGMLSHELRTPLNAILGHAELLRADPALSPAQRRSAEQISAGGEHLMAMVRELLDLAAIEAGKVVLAPAPVRLACLAEGCAAMISPAAATKGLAFGMEVTPHAAGWVAADAVRLRQVLLNLLGNAVKFTPSGEVVLRIRPAAAGRTRFEVTDTGPGMTEAECAIIFHEFLRLPAAAQAEGSGLGLAITARLVALMGGTLGCESEPGQGSLFWVELPLPPAEAVAEPLACPASPLPPGAPLRLLLADDVLTNREVAKALLRAAGHSVTTVADGEQAAALALAEDWDAVLLDVHMPVMDGRSAARLIRAAPGPRGRVPILAVTASANAAEVAECLAAGMDVHVEKPLRAWALQNALAGIRAGAARPAPCPSTAVARAG